MARGQEAAETSPGKFKRKKMCCCELISSDITRTSDFNLGLLVVVVGGSGRGKRHHEGERKEEKKIEERTAGRGKKERYEGRGREEGKQ